MRDLSYSISSWLFFMGYSLFILGVSSNAWKFQSGYKFGLWYRCDKRGCQFYEAGFTDYVTLMRGAISVAAVTFSIGMFSLCLEICIILANSSSTHRRRIGIVIDITTFVAEIIITIVLAYYGHRTITDRERLPHLLWGFAVTGVGAIVAFIGSILRTMGPTRSWDRFLCLRKAPKKTKKVSKKETRPPKKKEEIVLKGGKRYSKPTPQNKDVIVTKMPNQTKRTLPYLAPGVPYSDSYESLISNPEPSARAVVPHRYEEIPKDNRPIFFRTDNNLTVPRPDPVRRQENQYQISIDRSPRIKAFHTLPPPPRSDPLEDTVVFHSESGLSFDRLPSTSMHSFVYDWP